jgi:hypothetical protein
MWPALETGYGKLLNGREGGNAGNSQDAEGSYAGVDPAMEITKEVSSKASTE